MASTINSDNGVVSGSVGLKYASDNSGVLALQTNGNTAVTITSANNVGIGTTSPDSLLHVVNPLSASIRVGYSGGSTNYYDASVHTFRANTGSPSVFVANQYGIGLGTTTPSSGMGIAFPATQVASTDANTLDDYEEGTWTPSIGTGSTQPTFTYTARGGTYVKIGRQVIAWFYAIVSVSSAGSAQACLFPSSLPFVPRSDSKANSADYPTRGGFVTSNPQSLNNQTLFFNNANPALADAIYFTTVTGGSTTSGLASGCYAGYMIYEAD
jgi:hypothetical protein